MILSFSFVIVLFIWVLTGIAQLVYCSTVLGTLSYFIWLINLYKDLHDLLSVFLSHDIQIAYKGCKLYIESGPYIAMVSCGQVPTQYLGFDRTFTSKVRIFTNRMVSTLKIFFDMLFFFLSEAARKRTKTP
jgi:hypothetical protein